MSTRAVANCGFGTAMSVLLSRIRRPVDVLSTPVSSSFLSIDIRSRGAEMAVTMGATAQVTRMTSTVLLSMRSSSIPRVLPSATTANATAVCADVRPYMTPRLCLSRLESFWHRYAGSHLDTRATAIISEAMMSVFCSNTTLRLIIMPTLIRK